MVMFSDVNIRFRDNVVLKDFSEQFELGKINCVLGPSGCGKTTMLNLLAGIIKADSGRIVKPDRVSYVFQEDLLIPQKTARKNLELILKGVYKNKAQLDEVIDRFFKLSGLHGAEDLYPHEMSGGMRQRLALIRAFSYRSEILLMDEPFKTLDIVLKDSIIGAFFSLYEQDRPTVIFVTHDVDETLLIGDNVYIYNKSMCLQRKITINEDKPRKLYLDSINAVKNEIYKETEKWLTSV